jgi:cell division protein FtsI/penicillin-binding protein 2
MSGSARTRALVACCTLVCCFTGFSARLVYLQVGRHAEYSAQAAQNHSDRHTIYARRGAILDANGLTLAQNEPVKTVVADGFLIKDHKALARMLAQPLGMSEAVLLEKLTRERFSEKEGKKVPSRYIVLKKSVSEAAVAALSTDLAARKIRGIFFEQDSVRNYPNDEMLCHVIGFTDHTSNGIEGIEASMNDYLRGHDGFRYTERDRQGRELVAYRAEERPPRDGCNVRLTIDMALQTIVESELDEAVKRMRPKMATVILMRPQTGQILALANRPHYNLNQQQGVTQEQRQNRAIMDQVEPGSTFKIVTTASALAHRLVQPDTGIFCENGYFRYGGRALHDHHGYGELSVHDILVKSSNIGVAKMAIQLGDQRLYNAVRLFGFGDRTGVQLPGEIDGTVHPPHRWSKISITRIPMGHEVDATPLQVANSMCAIANGGRLLTPQIIQEITDAEGRTVATFPPVEVRRVIPESTAQQVRDALVEVVGKRGTAPQAAVPGFKVAGKTGTSEKITPGGTYKDGKYVASFVGFMPAEDPAFVALVIVDEARVEHGKHFGGLVAAPIFSKIAARAAQHLNLVPTVEEPLADKVLVTHAEQPRD